MLFLAGGEAPGWGEQRDWCCSSMGGVLDPKGSALEQRGGERDGKENADPWLQFWFPVTGSLCADPRGSMG